MLRAEIDNSIVDALNASGIKNFKVAWSRSPAMLSVLIGADVLERRISTQMTRRALNALLEEIVVWGHRTDVIRKEKRERLNESVSIGDNAGDTLDASVGN